MTIREAIVNTISPITALDGTIDLAIANAGLNANGTYDSSLRGQVETAAYYLLLGVSLITSEREGEYQITYDKSAVRAKLLYLAARNGIETESAVEQPLIKDVSYLW